MSLLSQRLKQATRDSTPEFSLCGQKLVGKVVSVYDGDTCQVVLPLFEQLYRFSVRLSGIDAPEMRSKNETEKRIAKYARDCLASLVLDRLVLVECFEMDKYGRLLASLSVRDTSGGILSVSNWMIDQRLCLAYDGGTKKCFDFSQETIEKCMGCVLPKTTDWE